MTAFTLLCLRVTPLAPVAGCISVLGATRSIDQEGFSIGGAQIVGPANLVSSLTIHEA